MAATTTQSSFPPAPAARSSIPPHRLRVPFAGLLDVVQYQVAQEARRLAIRVVVPPGAPAATIARVAAAVQAAIEESGAVAPPIEVEPVAELEREPGGAKLKVIKSVTGARAVV